MVRGSQCGQWSPQVAPPETLRPKGPSTENQMALPEKRFHSVPPCPSPSVSQLARHPARTTKTKCRVGRVTTRSVSVLTRTATQLLSATAISEHHSNYLSPCTVAARLRLVCLPVTYRLLLELLYRRSALLLLDNHLADGAQRHPLLQMLVALRTSSPAHQ